MKLNNKENPVITREENNKHPEKMSTITCEKHEENEERSVKGAEKKFLPDNDKDDEDDVFEVKMRKNRKSSNRSQNCGGDGIRNNSVTSSSSFLNSKTYSSSTLSLNKGSIFPTGRKKDSISMSLSRGGGSDGEDNVKITGYLEKRSKLLGWKKFWFVLDGRLLAYYKSKSDYDGLSVCCGSINLGIASTVRPIQIRGCKGYPIQIVTRSQVYYLKSPDKQILEQWLLAIQEAASSLPSKISLPVFCDPGSQFYRYSFAASSQWSLNTSCDDITETLSKLPLNFYLKGADPVRNLPQNNNLQKCHSFASLQSPSLYSTMSTSYKDKLNNNSSMKKKKSAALEAEDVSKIAGKYPAGCQNQQQSSAAGALKEELVRKLSSISVGKTGESETVKPSTVLTKPKAKSELPFLINPHQGEPHYYDEIVDFEAIYENFESNSDSSGESSVRNSVKSGGGGGGVDSATLLTKEKDANSEQTTQTNANAEKVVHIIDTEIYESVDSSIDENNGSNNNANNNLTKDVKNKHNSEIRISSGSNHKSSESSKNSKSKDFNTDQERERSQSLSINHNSGSKKGSKIIGPKVTTGQVQQPLFMEQERKLSIDSESSSITSSKENISDGKSKKRKNKPFGGFFHKMFHKSKKSKDKNAPNSTGNLVITGPIDLRSLHSDSALNRPTNLSIDEARKNNSLTRNASPGSTEEHNVIDELKVKVERNHHALPLTSVADHILSKVAQQNDDADDTDGGADNNTKKSAMVQRSNTITSTCRPKIPQKPKISPINTTSNANVPVAVTPSDENNDLFLTEPVVHRRKNSQSEDFQQKLAKFNRLSERLSSTFATALTSTPATQYTAIARSRSFKIQKGKDDCLPPLPPKKKNSTSSNAEKNFYDYPTNNRPVPPVKKVKGSPVSKNNKEEATTEQVADDKNDDEVDSSISKSSTFIRSLHKKNSAPDILFPSSNSGSGDSARSSKEGETDNVFEEILCPPPIPPKVKSSPNLGSPSLPVRSISPTPVIQEYHVPSSSKPVKTGEPPVLICDVTSSPTDNKADVAIKSLDTHKTSDTLTPVVADSTMRPNSPKPELQVSPEIKEDAKSITIVQEQKTPIEKNAVYQNLKFATVNTLVQEYETVEETEDEIAEMYDDFPSEYSGGGSHTYESIDSPLPQEHHTNFTTTPKLIRHSGMDELQTFLNSEITTSSSPPGEYSFPTEKAVFHHYDNVDEGDDVFDRSKKLPPTPTQIRAGAVSRLGHSSAIDQLKKMVNN